MPKTKHSPDYLNMLLNGLQAQWLDNLAGPYIGEIQNLNKSKGMTDIQPQGKLNGEKQPLVHNVHFIIMPNHYDFKRVGYGSPDDYELKPPLLDYKEGDQVLCVTLKHDNSNYDIESPKLFEIDTERKHSVDFSFVVAKIAKSADFKK